MKATKILTPTDDLVEVRTLLPRSELRLVQQVRRLTQHNCLPVTGQKPRSWLATLPSYRDDGGEVLSLGKTRSVDADAYIAWLRQRGEAADKPDQTDVVDAYAASLGLRAVAGGRCR